MKNFLPPAASEEDTGTPWQNQSQAVLHRECAGHAGSANTFADQQSDTHQTHRTDNDGQHRQQGESEKFSRHRNVRAEGRTRVPFCGGENFHVRCAGPSECGSCAATREIAARATAATAALAIARVAACHCARQGLGVRTVVCGCGRAGVWVVSAAVFAAAVLW